MNAGGYTWPIERARHRDSLEEALREGLQTHAGEWQRHHSDPSEADAHDLQDLLRSSHRNKHTNCRGGPVRIEAMTNPDDPDRELYEAGALLPSPHATLAGPTFQEWLDSISEDQLEPASPAG